MTRALSGWCICVAWLVIASIAMTSSARAQEEATGSVGADATGETAPLPIPESEPVPEIEPEPVVVAPRVPRRTTPASPATYDTELPPIALAPPPSAGFEIAIGMNPSLAFAGGLGGLAPAITTTTDLLIAIDPRAWIGFGIALSYLEQRSLPFPGSPEMRFVTTTIAVPLYFQYYFAHPELGAAVPTLRLRVAATWSETPNLPTPSTQTAGADLALYGGVTWMGASWLALRILGGLNGSFRATVVGPVVLTANVGIEAVIAAVVRL